MKIKNFQSQVGVCAASTNLTGAKSCAEMESKMEKKNVWETYNEVQLQELEDYAREYMDFLNRGKTERECVDVIVNKIEGEGYRELQTLIKEKKTLKKGDKVYAVCMNKSIVMFQIGEKPMAEGMNILGAHIDSPRLDVKQNPIDRKSTRLNSSH